MGYAFAADLMVVVHLAYMLFVVIGLPIVLLGGLMRWNWVRNMRLRVVHFASIAIVAMEAICGMKCPLTVWERGLRQMAGQPVSEATFAGRVAHEILFFQAEPWVFTLCYVAFALLVLGSFVLVPPKRRVRRIERGSPG